MDLRKLFNEGENNSKKGSDDESFGPLIFLNRYWQKIKHNACYITRVMKGGNYAT